MLWIWLLVTGRLSVLLKKCKIKVIALNYKLNIDIVAASHSISSGQTINYPVIPFETTLKMKHLGFKGND